MPKGPLFPRYVPLRSYQGVEFGSLVLSDADADVTAALRLQDRMLQLRETLPNKSLMAVMRLYIYLSFISNLETPSLFTIVLVHAVIHHSS